MCTLALLAGCSVAPQGAEFHDPYEATNRQIHAFNKSLDNAFVRPGGQATVMLPEAISAPVLNFADNVSLPGMVLNGVLQADVEGVVHNALRFIINSTIGLGGFFDPAGAIGVTEKSTDFGETLHVWGVPEGAYLELPLLGPSTQRDAAGELADILLNPLAFVGTPNQLKYGSYARIAEQVIDRGAIGDTIDSVLYESADSYAQARLIYLQNRRFELGQEAVDAYIDPYAQ